MNNYLSVVYNENDRPINKYPEQLAKHLFDKFGFKQNQKFLEVGCGRGDFIKAFKRLGLEVYGIDISEEAISLNPGIPIEIKDIDKQQLPYDDNSFDIIYSKSLLEHLYYPENYMKECYRVLKPNGILLTLVPDWETEYKVYFDDYTHRSPFTKVSLEDIYKIFNFSDVSVLKFRQLPIVWKHPWLNHFCSILSPFIPIRTETKFLKWTKRIMLVGYGVKK